ncbi:MAG: ATP-binding protein [Mariprofundaceae bacterium]|nr:ATP-binding protein [Mariprofundaceae bacterium]
MDRLLASELMAWKALAQRKPILLDGARQTGKTYLIEKCFGFRHFRKVIKLDFRANPQLADIFKENLKPDSIMLNMQLALNVDFDPQQDLVFFDEIGECQKALDSLKFFAEERPDIYICASGSNIGLIGSFPVGKVHFLELFPLSFEEFLMASGQPMLLGQYRQMARQQVVHSKLWDQLLDYYFVGGMPEAVYEWFKNDDPGIIARCQGISRIHRNLIAGYSRDFGKYAGRVNAQHIERVFNNVPSQLSRYIDDSVNRFRFSGVIEKKRGYMDLYGPIEWLEKSKLISKCYPINTKPCSPLSAYKKENRFKLFFFDIGLLGHMLGLNYAEHKAQNFSYKGYLAENFVQNELRCQGYYPTYAWQLKEAEIEFLYKNARGEVIPVEVKSGQRTQAKSLKSYIQQYRPVKTVKLVGVAGGTQNETDLVWPIYYTAMLKRL